MTTNAKIHKTLIIGCVWPEPNSSAAGQHMSDLIDVLASLSHTITFVSSANFTGNELDLSMQGITCKQYQPNDPAFDDFLSAYQPTLVMFDRFMLEEQFGWRVKEQCPHALRVLDTEDLFLVRKGREAAFKAGRAFDVNDLNSEFACREIAAIYRCDLTLVMSAFEYDLLVNHYKISPEQLQYSPLMLDLKAMPAFKAYDDTHDMVMIGNFLHAPNWDAVQWLHKDIWPHVRAQLPDANVYIYGAYTPQKAMQLHQPKKGFHICGRAESIVDAYNHARLNLAPVRFGAGLKGKVLEGLFYGVPTVTTDIGAEGIAREQRAWPGAVANDATGIIAAIVALYADKTAWLQAQSAIVDTLAVFEKSVHQQAFKTAIHALHENIEKRRQANFMGILLSHHQLQSTRYMSKWIEEKNKHRLT